MTPLDSQQQTQLSSTTPLVTVKDSNFYNAESETDTNYQNSKDKTNFKLVPKFIGRKQCYSILLKMINVMKELGLMLFVALTYAALTNNPPKVSKSPAAVPFFPKTSIVQDWYHGELSAALSRARQSDIAFIMFYAPWDAESQAVRKEFEIAARYMQNQVTFVAVNCWQPGGECRNQYSKAYNWPILIAYRFRGKGIHYRGINSAAYMIKFLISLSRPLIRIHKESEIDELLAVNDALVLGCLDALPGSHDYSVLYNTAVNILESDPTQDVPFLVLTGASNTCSRNHDGRAIILHLWNETLIYPSDEQWSPEAIMKWTQKNLHQVSTWAVPSGAKSYLLSNYIQPDPALILFTPRNPLGISEDYYNLLREVALEYYDCSGNNRVTLNSMLSLKLRIENYIKHKQNLEECGIAPKAIKGQQHEQSFPSVVTYAVPKKWMNNSQCQLNKNRNLEDFCSEVQLENQYQSNCKEAHNTNTKNYEKASAKNLNKSTDGKLNLRSQPNFQSLWREERCRGIRFAQRIYPSVFSESITNFVDLQRIENTVRYKGLGCRINTTLTFIALDSLEHYHFAERLGVDLSSKKDRTVAVIVNDKMETHHIIETAVNDASLWKFIIDFTYGNTARAVSSISSIKPKYTHVYSIKPLPTIKHSVEFSIAELNSETFLPTVLKDSQVVLVFYYSKQCAFCSGFSYTFLTAAKALSSLSIIKFVRIDGDLNSLPWEFTMERYPTILLFPFRRKAETRVFPQNLQITVSNIIGFLLSNLSPPLKLHVMQTLCNQTKNEEERLMCIAAMRSENMAFLGRTLKAWRNADMLTKSKLLYRLQQLRNINLLLALYPQHIEELERYTSQLYLSTEDYTLVNSAKIRKRNIKEEL